MATLQYTAKEGDFLDWVVYRHYGFVDSALEAVMDHAGNAHLHRMDEELEAGVVILLPDVANDDERVVRLWD